MQSCESKSQQTYLQCSFCTKTLGLLWNGRWKEKKMKKFDVRLYLLAMSEKLCFIKSHQLGLAKHDLSKDNTNRQTTMD